MQRPHNLEPLRFGPFLSTQVLLKFLIIHRGIHDRSWGVQSPEGSGILRLSPRFTTSVFFFFSWTIMFSWCSYNFSHSVKAFHRWNAPGCFIAHLLVESNEGPRWLSTLFWVAVYIWPFCADTDTASGFFVGNSLTHSITIKRMGIVGKLNTRQRRLISDGCTMPGNTHASHHTTYFQAVLVSCTPFYYRWLGSSYAKHRDCLGTYFESLKISPGIHSIYFYPSHPPASMVTSNVAANTSGNIQPSLRVYNTARRAGYFHIVFLKEPLARNAEL